MAEGKADGAAKKPAFSSRLLQMKFMQRGKEKPVVKEAVTAQVRSSRHISFPVWLLNHTHGMPKPLGLNKEKAVKEYSSPTQCCGITRSMAKIP